MGPNKQRGRIEAKPKAAAPAAHPASRFARKQQEFMLRRRGGAAASDEAVSSPSSGAPRRDAPSFLSQQSRDMVVDVLRHVASGGESEVSTKYFDPNFGLVST